MFKKNLDNFEVISSGNERLYEAIKYIKNNIDTAKFNKIKKSGLLSSSITSKMELVPFLMEMDNMESFGTLFRQTHTADNILTIIWVSKVKSVAKERLMLLNKYYNDYQLTKDDLKEFAKLSITENNLKSLSDLLLSNYGICLVFVPNITGMKTDAVTFKLESGHYVIGMSLRINLYDSFWFTLMHELSHIHMHKDILNEPHLDYFSENNIEINDIEIEANLLARNLLIPRKIWAKCKARITLNKKDIELFASEYDIHPAIVAGFIRFEKNNYTIFSNIIHQTNVREEIKED